jgi:benzoate membrane transport protein
MAASVPAYHRPLPAVPVSALTAGIVPPLVGFAGTVALVIRAGQAMGGTPAEISSGIVAMCIAVGATGILLSYRWRMPLVLAWSTPGAALLASSGGRIDYRVALGAYVAAATLMIVVALVPALTRMVARVPAAIASGLLAGILLPFGLKLFGCVPEDPWFAIPAIATFLLLRAVFPRHALSGSLAVSILLAMWRSGASGAASGALFGHLSAEQPHFSWQAIAGIAIPLFLVTLVSQNLPGLIVMQAAGYRPSARHAFLATGAATLIVAPFGGFGINLAAIVAALCTGADAHPDPSRRWIVGIFYGATWIGLGLFSAVAVRFLLSLPTDVIAVITGVALLGPLIAALQSVSAAGEQIDAAAVTLVVTASGLTLLGIGSAFWGLVAAFAVLGARAVWLRAGRAVSRPAEPQPSR